MREREMLPVEMFILSEEDDNNERLPEKEPPLQGEGDGRNVADPADFPTKSGRAVIKVERFIEREI